MSTIVERVLVMKTVPALADAPDEMLAELAAVMEQQEIPAGTSFIHEGEHGDAMYVIVEGEVEVQVGGRRIALLGAREVVGELAMFDPQPRSATVTALTDVICFRLDHMSVAELIEDDPAVAMGAIRLLCRRLRRTTEMAVGR